MLAVARLATADDNDKKGEHAVSIGSDVADDLRVFALLIR